MENRVRDLEQLEERDPEDRGRRIGTIVMATLGIVALTFAMGVVVGKAAEPDEVARDPLDQLDRVASAAMKPSVAQAQAEPAMKIDAADLTFQKTLTEDEDRPEVLAALEAAAKEEERLAVVAAPAEGTMQAAEAVAQAVRAPAAQNDDDDAVEDDADEQDEQPADDDDEERGVLPASVAAGSAGHKLIKAAKHDQLVANALPADDAKETAPHGEEGEFTLQVISYDAPAPAQAFASGLRAKGHEAFVQSADVPDRGRYYRVRIGPFKVREKAEAYRRKFEEQEHMNTIVVKRPKDGAEH